MGEHRTAEHVRDGDRSSAREGNAACTATIIDELEVLEERRLEAALCDHLQAALASSEHLNVGATSGGDRHGGVERQLEAVIATGGLRDVQESLGRRLRFKHNSRHGRAEHL